MPVKIINPLLHQALVYAQAGLAVLPIFEPTYKGCSCGRANCNRAGKHPRVGGGVHEATKDPNTISSWWTKWPEANIGIATGRISNLFVLDVDGTQGAETLENLVKHEQPLSKGACVYTGNGRHYYFRCANNEIRNSVGKIGIGIDIRGEGGYVVAAGSLHRAGTRYRVCGLRGRRPRLLVADPPSFLVDLIRCHSSRSASSQTGGDRRAVTYAEAALREELIILRQAQPGTRNDALNRSAFRLGQLIASSCLSEDRVISALTKAGLSIDLAQDEIAATIMSGIQAGKSNPRGDEHLGGASSPPPRLEDQDRFVTQLAALGETDADNAQRLATRYSHRLVYTLGSGFLVYDGKRWCEDKRLERVLFAEETARRIADEASHRDRNEERAFRTRFSKASLSKSSLDRMLDLAKPLLMREDKKLDSNIWYFNVDNGTIDLRNGLLKPHDPSDLITKISGITFDSSAACAQFEAFLRSALGGDAELVAYVQKAFGLTLTGVVTEQVFFFPYGPGRTGKSTLVNLFRDLMGDYGLHTPTETLLAKQYDNNIPTDLARMAGARMITAIEANWNRPIDEARLKAMTGGEPITARYMRRDFFQFQPEFKLWFVANDLPGVRGTASAFWARVRVIPFNVIVSDKQTRSRPNSQAQARVFRHSGMGCQGMLGLAA